MTTIWLDGKWLDRDTATISVFDHGLLYGDGIFEGIRVYNGRVFRLGEHMDRLYASARAINLDIGMAKAEFSALVEEAVKRSGLRDAYIRPIVTRGVGDLGIDARNCKKPTIMIIVDSIRIWPEERYEKGLKCVTASTPIPHREALSPRVKSLNYLPHVMAKMEGNVAGADEVIMLDASGHVCEGSGQNIFLVNGKSLRTPPRYAGILLGVTRNAVMEIAASAGYAVKEELFNRYDVYTADEVFLTGTASELAPVTSLDGRTVGTGKPGPVTRDLMAKFRALVRD